MRSSTLREGIKVRDSLQEHRVPWAASDTNGMRPTEAKIRAVREWDTPQDVKTLNRS